jgi:hypothetical protein
VDDNVSDRFSLYLDDDPCDDPYGIRFASSFLETLHLSKWDTVSVMHLSSVITEWLQ